MLGEVAVFAALIHLGGDVADDTYLDADTDRTSGLRLTGSGVHGPATALRALPGLGVGWDDFSSCAAFESTQNAAYSLRSGTSSGWSGCNSECVRTTFTATAAGEPEPEPEPELEPVLPQFELMHSGGEYAALAA